MILISDYVQIPESELAFRYSRSSGPGGQNVNKVATKVTLLFDVRSSSSLTGEQRARIAERLARRISKDGVLHLSSDRHRTRGANQREVVGRFVDLLREALRERVERTPTRIPDRERQRRRDTKRHRSRVKELRRRPPVDD